MNPVSTPADPLVRVEDLHTYYGKSHILHGVSLAVGRGEVVGLLGRNGVGKSTTLKTIMGLVPPNQGTITLEARPVTGMPAHKLAKLGIGYVPEDRHGPVPLTFRRSFGSAMSASAAHGASS
jgi:branched-chain amino acid transport system ATP-binding protein